MATIICAIDGVFGRLETSSWGVGAFAITPPQSASDGASLDCPAYLAFKCESVDALGDCQIFECDALGLEKSDAFD